MPITKTYRVIVELDGRAEPIKGPVTTDQEEAQRDLAVITEAQTRGTNAIVALPWLSVREHLIAAAYIREALGGSSVPRADGRRYRTSTEGYMRDDPWTSSS